ncbi:hypothetical protein ACIBCM_25570 [Streptomyces sp. NPDC051018]|uniref:hypothetical protein n=1 Tax=Streptomyces sp. NPDC051018 TaxID=3365639 RepID=UPI0037A0FB47
MTEQTASRPAPEAPEPEPETAQTPVTHVMPVVPGEPAARTEDPPEVLASHDTAHDTPHAPPAPARDRWVLRAVGRWSAAVLVCVGLGAGTAYGITSMERTDVPGLATKSDGRWDYPRLSLPALPEGSPRPFSKGNDNEVHHADLRDLLLPAPEGARADKKLNGGWTTIARFGSEYEEESRAEIRQALDDAAVRHIAARGWTMPDGTASRVYLLRFDSLDSADMFARRDLGAGTDPGLALTNMPEGEEDPAWQASGGSESTSSFVFRETGSPGPLHTRQAYLVAGDTVALVVHEKKGSAAAVPFHQTVALQSQLLS